MKIQPFNIDVAAMEEEIGDVQVSDVEFLETLKEGNNSAVFKVKLRGMLCIMKVVGNLNPSFIVNSVYWRTKYRGKQLSDACSPVLEYNLFGRESLAYRRLKEHGLCKRGVIPDFYGTSTQINPKVWPDLYMFHKDELPADALFIEYVPNMHKIDPSNFSKEKMAKLREILVEFHELGVYHGDPYPRNMMIADKLPGEQKRVLWIDFDSAQTLQLDNLSERNRDSLRKQIQMMDYFSDGIVSCPLMTIKNP